jgi:hypothetical protein
VSSRPGLLDLVQVGTSCCVRLNTGGGERRGKGAHDASGGNCEGARTFVAVDVSRLREMHRSITDLLGRNRCTAPAKSRVVYVCSGDAEGRHGSGAWWRNALAVLVQPRWCRMPVARVRTLATPATCRRRSRTGWPRPSRNCKVPLTLTERARRSNPIVRGWTWYCWAFYRSALCPLPARMRTTQVLGLMLVFAGHRALRRATERVLRKLDQPTA